MEGGTQTISAGVRTMTLAPSYRRVRDLPRCGAAADCNHEMELLHNAGNGSPAQFRRAGGGVVNVAQTHLVTEFRL